jgi:nitroreductase
LAYKMLDQSHKPRSDSPSHSPEVRSVEVFEAIEKRRTCRSFKMDTLPSDIIRKLLRAGQRAPTGGNANTRRFVLIDDRQKLKVIQKISPGYLGASPLAIAICTDLEVDQNDSISVFDAGAAAENIALAATALGLGVGFVKSFPEGPVRKMLGIPSTIRLDILVTLGYRSDLPKARRIVRSPHQPVFHNSYGIALEAS